MLVSSRHLSLASRVFKAMLQENFEEGEILRRDGHVEIPLPEDTPSSFKILMNIVHAKNKAIPSNVDLPLLTEFAILVDKYRMPDAAGFISGIWISNLASKIPRTMSKEIMSWMAIGSVFRNMKEFNGVAWIAATHAD